MRFVESPNWNIFWMSHVLSQILLILIEMIIHKIMLQKDSMELSKDIGNKRLGLEMSVLREKNEIMQQISRPDSSSLFQK